VASRLSLGAVVQINLNQVNSNHANPNRPDKSARSALGVASSQAQAFARSKEAVLAEVAAQRNHADTSKQKIKNAAMGSSNVGFTAFGACNTNHGEKPPGSYRPLK
jgi:aconitase A